MASERDKKNPMFAIALCTARVCSWEATIFIVALHPPHASVIDDKKMGDALHKKG